MCAGAAKKPTTATTTHATAPVFTHSQAGPGTSWLTITATTRRHAAANKNPVARALALASALAWAVGDVGADPAGR